MKVLFISDIHGIDKNINKIEEVITNKNIDRIVCLGDVLNPNYSSKVVEFLKKYKDRSICMKGNCDSDFDEKEFNLIPGLYKMNLDGIDIYLNHGHEYNIDKDNFNGDILIYGHKHIPYIRKKDNKIFICVGSISLPRDDNGSSYMIYEDKTFIIYDMDNNVVDGIKI